ncbi:PH domain-containing protein [Listeria sp. FSL L7-0091]|uniref:PH domain-containing protein n=1 Tax=Listeria farberi TaxID=2713500 RepID=UPI0016265ED2|nr:PH domain-containing protein [Listeria farberi]MBC2262814.1 PH domain-containing protein [Listeria farberi]
MKEIKPTYTWIISSMLWSWCLAFIPTIITTLKMARTKYIISDTHLVMITGLVHSKRESIDLYRIRIVTANQTAWGYGNITIIDQDSISYVLRYINNANYIANVIKEKSRTACKNRNFTVVKSLF